MDKSHRTDLTFSRQLEKAMTSRSIGATKLSRMSGIQRSQICKYLTAEMSPTAMTIRKLAIALGVTSDYLLGLIKADKQ
nr:MAG TPA: helix-turn-helix domain protein [Caudoviricetes sp.]